MKKGSNSFIYRNSTELSNQEVLYAMNAANKNSSLYMNTVRRLFDKKIEIQNDVKKSVKDETDRKNIIKDLDKIFEQQIEVLRKIIYGLNLGSV